MNVYYVEQGNDIFYSPCFRAKKDLMKADEYAAKESYYVGISEDDVNISLQIKRLLPTETKGIASSKEIILGSVTFNKQTKHIDEDLQFVWDMDKSIWKDLIHWKDLYAFVGECVYYISPYLFKEIEEVGLFEGMGWQIETTLRSHWRTTYELCMKSPDFVEQLLKTSLEVWTYNVGKLSYEEFVNKFKETKIPAKILYQIKNDYLMDCQENLINLVQYICQNEDPNNAIIFMQALEDIKRLWATPSRALKNEIAEFHQLAQMGYNSKQLLDYIVRQQYFYSSFNCSPNSRLNLLLDYIKTAKKHSLSFVKFPPNLEKAHNCMANNVNALEIDESVLEKFQKHSAQKSYLNAMHEDWQIIVPKDPKEIVEEGNNLNHCVGNYVYRIAEGETTIVFLRTLDEPNVSMYTLEVNDQNEVIQAKKNFNEDVSSDVWDIIKEFEKGWKK